MNCSGCTLCCKLLRIPWMDSPESEYCRECESEVGCKIWEDRPEGCRSFGCSYYNVEKANENLRPDRCGIIFEKATKDIFFGTVDDNIVVLNEIVNVQINKFLDEGFSIILRHPQLKKPYILAAEGKTANDIWEEAKEAWSHRVTTQI